MSPLFVPLYQQQYAHTAGDRYRLEKAAYQSAKNEILLGTDDFHQLLLLRAAEPQIIEEENLSSIYAFLVHNTLSLDSEISKRFLDILQKNAIETIEEAECLLEQLSTTFPDFYFAPTGIFLPYLGWQIAPHILRYNNDRIEHADMVRLEKICDVFRSKSNIPKVEQMREINADIKLQHIVKIDDHWEIIDREHRTIGTAENQLAAFLFSLFVRDSKFSQDWGGAFEQNYLKNCSRNELLAALSYRLFCDAVMHTILRDIHIEPHLCALEGLMSK